jgi:hypothetical protein
MFSGVFMAWCLVKHRANFTFTSAARDVYDNVVYRWILHRNTLVSQSEEIREE